MAAISSTIPNAATEPVLIYSAVSFANRAALRAAKVALNLRFAGAQLAKDGQPFVETAAMTSARLALEAALCLTMQAPVQTGFDPILQKAADHLLRGLQGRNRDELLCCEALCREKKIVPRGQGMSPAEAVARRILGEWAPLAGIMARSAQFRDRLRRAPS